MSSKESSKRRRVARACDACRRKKVRCDGIQAGSDPPSCTNCKACNYECSFIDAPKKRGPPKGYIEALETRLKRMESLLGNIAQSGNLPEGVIDSNLEWINTNENSFKTSRDNTSSSNSLRKSCDLLTSNNEEVSTSKNLVKSHESHNGQNSDTDDSLSSDDNDSCQYELNDSMGQLTIDENGRARYLGTSSGIFLFKKFAENVPSVLNAECPKSYPKRIPYHNVAGLPPKELCDKLLELYWIEIHEPLPFIDKEDFLEKYNNLESSYPTFILLLYAMFAIASTYLRDPVVYKDPNDPSTAGNTYVECAKEILKEEFDNATITNVQALILLSGHQQGARNSSSWLYLGIAIRLAQDMGLHRDASKWNLTPRETEIRKRVWWACVTADRLSCASLGRPLAINEADCDVGFPTYGAIPNDSASAEWVNTIKIILLLGRVLSHVYGIKSRPNTNGDNSVLAALDKELNELRPPDNDSDRPVTKRRIFLQLLYHTIQILLHRPHIRGPKSKAPPSSIPSLTICTTAANNITHFLYRAMRDGKLQQTWPYTINPFFTATTMHLINALSGDDRFKDTAKYSLKMVLKCLEFMIPYWFAAEKCLNVINELIRINNINLDGVNGTLDGNCSNGKQISKKRRSEHQSSASASETGYLFKHSTAISHFTLASPPTVTSQTSATNISIQEYSAAMRQQHMVTSTIDETPPIIYDQNSSPDSEIQLQPSFNEFTINANNEFLFPPNADSFTPDVSSLLFNDSDPFISIPTAIDWTNFTDWAEMIGLRQLKQTDINDQNLISNSIDLSTNMLS